MKQHILFIDDDKDELVNFVDALKMVHAEDGFKCTYASSAEQALEMLRYLVPDYIFVDLNIPKKDGLEFLAAIRKETRLRDVKKYLYSGMISEAASQQAVLLGVSGCIKKGSVMNELAGQLKEIFDVYTVPSAG